MIGLFCSNCKLIWSNILDEDLYIIGKGITLDEQCSCLSCMDLIRDSFYLNIVSMVTAKIEEQGYTFQNFALNLSIPNILLENEKLLTSHFREDAKLKDPFHEQESNGHGYKYTFKDVWKIIVTDQLEKKFRSLGSGQQDTTTHPLYSKDSDFSITITYTLPQSPVPHDLSTRLAAYISHPSAPTPSIPPQGTPVRWNISVALKRKPVFLAGRYLKLSRSLSQTPWIVRGGERRMETSLEEIIKGPLAAALPSDPVTFSASGREDVDVRCLGRGRPFALQIANLRPDPDSDVEWDAVLGSVTRLVGLFRFADPTPDGHSHRRHHALAGPGVGEADGVVVVVKDLQRVGAQAVSRYLKQGECSKSKSYRALCYSPRSLLTRVELQHLHDNRDGASATGDALEEWFAQKVNLFVSGCHPVGEERRVEASPSRSFVRTSKMVEKGEIGDDGPEKPSATKKFCPDPTPIMDPVQEPFVECDGSDGFGGLDRCPPSLIVQQKTPIRVLHRRTLLNRPRSVYEIDVKFLDDHYFILDIRCQAGFYVKEFVHSDFGRTVPSITSILGSQIYLVELDVTEIHLDWPPSIPNISSII